MEQKDRLHRSQSNASIITLAVVPLSPRPPHLSFDMLKTSLDTLTLADFHPFMGHTFDVLAGEGDKVTLTLVRGTEVPRAAGPKAQRTPFALLFRGPREGFGIAGDGVYTLRRAEDWAIDNVFITPVIAPEEEEPGIYYQCCFG